MTAATPVAPEKRLDGSALSRVLFALGDGLDRAFLAIHNHPVSHLMLAWYSSLGVRGRLFFWGTFGVVVNGAIYFMGIWMPILLFVSIGMLFVAALMKSEDSTDI